MAFPWSKKKKVIDVRKKFDPIDDEDNEDDDPLMSLTERIELVAKDSQIRLKDIEKYLKDILVALPTVAELKDDIKSLRAELAEEKAYNRELIHKLVDKPAPVSLATQLAAQNRAEQAKAGNNNTAGPKGRLP